MIAPREELKPPGSAHDGAGMPLPARRAHWRLLLPEMRPQPERPPERARCQQPHSAQEPAPRLIRPTAEPVGSTVPLPPRRRAQRREDWAQMREWRRRTSRPHREAVRSIRARRQLPGYCRLPDRNPRSDRPPRRLSRASRSSFRSPMPMAMRPDSRPLGHTMQPRRRASHRLALNRRCQRFQACLTGCGSSA